MHRLLLLVIACMAQVGCQAPTTGFDPFAFGRQTRVPPPPTNVIGNAGASGTFQQRPAPLPAVDAGAATGPQTNYASSNRYWDAAPVDEAPTTVEASRRPPATQPRATTLARNAELTRNDRLTWRDPDTKQIFETVPTNREQAVTADLSNAPRLLTGTGPVQSLASSGYYPRRPVSAPVRVRGFSSAGSQDVRIPAALDEFQHNGDLRQAARWEPRYDDIRR